MRYLDLPAKVLFCAVSSVVGHSKWPHDDGTGDPFWSGGASPVDYQWVLTATVTPQGHSNHRTRQPYVFNGLDVHPGDWIAHQQTGVALKIVQVLAKTETSITCVVEDFLRYNTHRDQTGFGSGIFPTPANALIFNLNESGLPVVDPIPADGVGAAFFANLMSRFQNQEQSVAFFLEQENHGFSVDQLVSVDAETGKFTLTTARDPYIVGTVSHVNSPHSFAINPLQKVINFDSLVGRVGSIIYSDDSVPGGLTTTPGGKPVMIKLREYTQSWVESTVVDATTTPGSVFKINGVPVTVGGSGSTNDLIDAVNAGTSFHGVTASSLPSPTVVKTSLSMALGEPALNAPSGGPYAVATINGVSVTFATNTRGMALYGAPYALEEDMAADINAANIPGITASTETNRLVLTHATGGPITIVNVTPDIDGIPFAGPNSGSGLPLSTPASTGGKVLLTAIDARAINLLDVTGTVTTDFGLVSAENGTKAAALYIEQGLRSASTTVLPSIANMEALAPVIGDMAFVLDKGDGEWGLFLFDGSNWEIVSTEESARTDAKTISIEIAHDSDPTGIIGEISGNTRVNRVVVSVIEPFDADTTLSVLSDDGFVLMPEDQNDLSVVGEYTTTPSHVFTRMADINVEYSLQTTATTGRALISISYS